MRPGTKMEQKTRAAFIAHTRGRSSVVERFLAKEEAVSSNLIARSRSCQLSAVSDQLTPGSGKP